MIKLQQQHFNTYLKMLTMNLNKTKCKRILLLVCLFGFTELFFYARNLELVLLKRMNKATVKFLTKNMIQNSSYSVFNADKGSSGTSPPGFNEIKTLRSAQPEKKKVSSDRFNPLDYIPSVADCRDSEHVPYLSDKLTKKFLELPETRYEYSIAILTPVRNSEGALHKYRSQVSSLTYPHELLSVYFGEDGSTDNTFKESNRTAIILKNQHNFTEAKAIRLNISGGFQGPQHRRHEEWQQKTRRAHMAIARNLLMRYALQQNEYDYILWIDCDIEEFPPDLVQQMLFAKSDVVAVSCLMQSPFYKVKYDRNSWKETNVSLQVQNKLEPEALVLEGYRKTLRVYLPDLKAEGRIVSLDGVGGCALMVKADCFRSGLQFPEVVYKHHIETEGLAKMAHDMGYTVVGLPFVEVFHT